MRRFRAASGGAGPGSWLAAAFCLARPVDLPGPHPYHPLNSPNRHTGIQALDCNPDGGGAP
ncbi:hypothetical protein STAFG_2548 [Streptomyces afghaniensis 772]|uniref:Uncharacterized protein n=1 Tax=Streptomyces afghaniensis 772 TaxID=1283301 RepID=S4MWY3_9ACTN|nr:hypothetical protein STAFG_2548 [Streptomyces afghaniensis 772]